MIGIKIVTLKKYEEVYPEQFSLCEDKSYTIDKYEKFLSVDKNNYARNSIKVGFLKLISRNEHLEKVITEFREKFNIEKNLPLTNYYYGTYPGDEADIFFYPNKQITEEEAKFIKNIEEKYYIHELLKPILIDLLYTGKVCLERINSQDIAIKTDEDISSKDKKVSIEILSNKKTHSNIIDFVKTDYFWNTVKNKIAELPETRQIPNIRPDFLGIYDLRKKGVKFKKIFETMYIEQFNDKNLTEKISNMSIEQIVSSDEIVSEMIVKESQIKQRYYRTEAKINLLFEPLEDHPKTLKRANKRKDFFE